MLINHNSKEFMKKKHKFSIDNNTDIFYYMPLSYVEKDKEDPTSIVQTLGAP